MPAKKRPRIDQILTDLDGIGARKPSSLHVEEEIKAPVDAPAALSDTRSPFGSPPMDAPPGWRPAKPSVPSGGHAPPLRRTTSGDASPLSRSPASLSSEFGDGSVFASELERQNKRLDDVVDLAMFLVQTYATSGSAAALESLVQHLAAHGAQKVVTAVKRAGQLAPFVAALIAQAKGGDFVASRVNVAFLRFYRFIADLAPAEVLCSKAVFQHVLRALDPTKAVMPASGAPPPPAAAVHWSLRFKAAPAAKPAVDDAAEASLELTLAQLFDHTPCYMADSVTATAVEILLKLVFNRNQALDTSFGPVARGPTSSSSAASIGDDGAVLLLRLGGFPVLDAVLRRPTTTSDERLKVLQLLDVVTCSGSALAGEDQATAVFAALFETVLSLFLQSSDDADDAFLTALRVAINITSLFPTVATARPMADMGKLLRMLQRSAATDSPLADCHVYFLCLVINMLVKGKNVLLCDAVTANDAFLTFAAAEMRRLHTADDAERNVAAGYYATLLGMLSLASQDARVRVKHAVGGSGSPSCNSPTAVPPSLESQSSGSSWSGNPLKYVVAILQEFVLFQSAAGILTQEALLGIHQLLQSLLNANHDIVVEASLEEDGDA